MIAYWIFSLIHTRCRCRRAEVHTLRFQSHKTHTTLLAQTRLPTSPSPSSCISTAALANSGSVDVVVSAGGSGQLQPPSHLHSLARSPLRHFVSSFGIPLRARMAAADGRRGDASPCPMRRCRISHNGSSGESRNFFGGGVSGTS